MPDDDYSYSWPSWNASYSYSYIPWEGYPLSRQITAGTFMISISLFTMIGNLMVMVAFYRDRRINSKIANSYIVNLSVADFLVGAFSLPITIQWSLKGWWIFSTTFCKLFLLVDYVAVTIPVCSIICISLDRYWLLTKKLNYPKYATKTKATIFLISMWTFSFAFYGIITFAWLPITGSEPHVGDYDCELEALFNFSFQLFTIAFFFILPLITICCLNLVVYLNIYKRAKGFVQSKPPPSQPKRQPIPASASAQVEHEGGSTGVSSISISVQEKDTKKTNPATTSKPVENKKSTEFNRHRKAAITLAVLVGVFIFCWAPFYFGSIVQAVCEDCFPWQVWTVTNWILWSNSMINPFLYAAMNVNFRENFLKFLCLDKLLKKRAVPQTTMTKSG